MDKGRLEHKIKDALSDHKEYIDKGILWEGLQEKKKRRRFPFLWIFGLGLLLMVAGFFTLSWDNQNSISDVEMNMKEIFDKESDRELQSRDIIQPIEIQKEEKTIGLTSIHSQNLNPIEKEGKIQADESKLINSASTHIGTRTQSSQNITTILSQAIINSTNKESIKNRVQEKQDNSVETTEALQDDLGYINATEKEMEPLEDRPFEITDPSDLTFVKEITDLVKEKEMDQDSDDEIVLEPKVEEVPNVLEKDLNNVLQYSDKGFLTVYIGYGFVDKKIVSLHPECDRLAFEKSISESPLEDLGIGVKVGKNLFNNFYGSIGIEWHRLQESFSYNTSTEEPELTNGVIAIIVYENGDIEEEFGMVEKSVTHNFQYRVYNTFSRWEIPFTVGYAYRTGKLGWSAELASHINLNSQFNGYLLDKEFNVIDHNESIDVGIQNFFSFRMDYFLKDGFSIWLSGTRHLNSVSMNLLDQIDQKYGFYIIKTGAQYHF